MFRYKKIKQTALIFALAGLIASCKKTEDLSNPILGLEGDTWAKTSLDTWLYDNFTKPYNIEVKYRWDNTENNYSYTVVPPGLDKVQPIMEVVKHAWIDVYAAEAGEAFVKKYAPKQYVLIGSLRYNASTVTLGEAEGGNKVMLLGVNEFNKTDRDRLKRVLKTIHHEFTHILNQTVMFPIEFRQISKGLYTGTWNQVSLTDAREQGFISSYAMADPVEDFAEMTSIMLTEGKGGFDSFVNGITAEKGKAAIRAKESIVVTYFKQVWNIDIYSLQQRVQNAIDDLAPLPLTNFFGFGKTYTSLLAEPATIANGSGDFAAVYNAAKTNLFTNGSSRTLDAVYLQFIAADKASLRVRYVNSAGSAFLAYFGYDVAVNSQGEVTLTFTGNLTNTNSNSNVVGPYLTALTGYFNGTFKKEWPGGRPSPTPPVMGGLYKTTNPASFFMGELGN